MTSESTGGSEKAPLRPWQRYQRDLSDGGFSEDPAQEAAVRALDDLHRRLTEASSGPGGPRWLRPLRGLLAKQAEVEPITGLYLWGGVGRGKTYLMDTFFESLPFEDKLRLHFHRFMRRVHHELGELQGAKDPLAEIADRLARQARVLCFDEFYVSDITDAMILGELLEQVFARGVCLVATSNIVPDELYWNGLQRQRFLPAIERLNRHTRVLNVDGGVDYRLRTLTQAEIYHWPLDAAAGEEMARSFNRLAPEGAQRASEAIDIEGRRIAVRRCGEDVLWCDFEQLCTEPRSQNDYIEIARLFHAVLLSNVPVMDDSMAAEARRFIALVDEFYDHNVKLIIAAEASMEDLYTGQQLAFEFQRTRSRLMEMQSHDYLARSHKA